MSFYVETFGLPKLSFRMGSYFAVILSFVNLFYPQPKSGVYNYPCSFFIFINISILSSLKQEELQPQIHDPAIFAFLKPILKVFENFQKNSPTDRPTNGRKS